MLLSPSVQGLEMLVSICEKHAQETDLVFSTDSIAFQCKNKEQLVSIKLNGDPLPWKDKVNHLGFTLPSNCSSPSDVMEKRATFISNVYSLIQESALLLLRTS
jgi:hypothetical protein